MRIDAFQKLDQVYQTGSTSKLRKSEKKELSDKVEISQTGKDYQTAKMAVATAPDIREEKVEALRRSIASGTYNVSGEELADKLIDNYFSRSI